MSGEKRKLILEDGTVFTGEAFGADEEKMVELVFNTSMAGYQEIISDPSYTYQAVCMTYPLIGNYGICEDDYETVTPSIAGLVVRDYCDEPSNFRCAETLDAVMKRYGIVGLAGVDTRKLSRHIRKYGSCKALITDYDRDVTEAVRYLKDNEIPVDAVSRVSTKEIYEYEEGRNDSPLYHVVAIDCGMKLNIARKMFGANCRITVVPFDTPADKILELKPDGVFISNGPGDPTDVKETIRTVSELKGRIPIFGICLGHQIISLAYGARTYKLKFGHRGGNHPVRNLLNDKLEITSQNHSYAVEADSVEGTGLEVTHINLLDNTIEGVRCQKDRVFSVQYHPESAPGPQDSGYLFGEFLKEMDEFRGGRRDA
ncbi:MAG: glutamine-hydrolyzing carbamoyl-phosphate synthase small subunit [Lachnospiraceae bacterium]|nr:glutamine-hydrolyzing carbamoyl-phosphate synthase small subunit [Lachnospiraceae bacterium]